MAELDLYESVLGIPPGRRPPNHYELLGLELFESSPLAIETRSAARIADAEQSVLASAANIRRVVEEIEQAKACLLDKQTKSDYDRQLNQRIPGIQIDGVGGSGVVDGPDTVAGSGVEGGSGLMPESIPGAGEPHDEPQFEPLPAELIAASRSIPRRNTRRLFWTFTLIEILCGLGLLLYLRPIEPIAMPKLLVNRSATGQPDEANPPDPQPPRRPAPRRVASAQPAPPSDPFAPADPVAPGNSTPGGDSLTSSDAQADAGPPASTTAEGGGEAMPPPLASAANANQQDPARSAPTQLPPQWPREWEIRFAANADWTVDQDMLPLGADELKAVAAFREQPLFTLRDPGSKKPIAALPFDAQGHLSGLAVAMLPRKDWRACLSYENQVLLGRTRIFDAQRKCVYFADYRNKGRAKLLCLCADGVPVAVQIWRGKESVAYLVELAEARPVAREQKQLSVPQTERLAAALAELASIEALIRQCEKDWKSQLSEWWRGHDNALKTILALPIADGDKQARVASYKQKLLEQQHAGLDKWLAPLEPPTADPTVPKP